MRSLRGLTLTLTIILSSMAVHGQVTTFYSQYLHNPVFNNIGLTARENKAQLMTQYRNMTLANGGLVHTSSLSYIKPLYYDITDPTNKEEVLARKKFGGFNISLTDGRAGRSLVYKNTSLLGGFTYNIRLKRKLILGVGMQADFMFKRIDPAAVTTDSQVVDGVFDPSNDINEQFSTEATMSYMLNTGFSLQSFGTEDKLLYQLGASFYNIGKTADDFVNETPERPIVTILTADFLAYHRGVLDVRPHARMLWAGEVNVIDTGISFRYYMAGLRNLSLSRGGDSIYGQRRKNDWYFGTGLTYRNTGAMIMSANLQRDDFLIGISFDLPFDKTQMGQLTANNSLEVLLSYRFGS